MGKVKWARRDFIGLMTLGTGGLVSNGVFPLSASEKKELDQKQYDVVVCGGGVAGFPAAIAASRQGAKVAIIERYGFLGGNAATSIMPAWHGFPGGHTGFLTEFANRVREFGVGPNPFESSHIEPEVVKIMFLNMSLENSVDLYLHHFIAGVEKKGNHLTEVITISKSGYRSFKAKVFVDSTGDGDVAALAGNPYVSFVDGNIQGMSLRFRIGHVDVPAYIDWAIENLQYFRGKTKAQMLKIKADYLAGKTVFIESDASQVWDNESDPDLPHDTYFVCSVLRPDELSVNATRIYGLDGTNADDLTKAEIKTRKQAWAISRYLKKNIPGFEKSMLTETAPQIGVRESRKITGKYVLTSDDCEAYRRFDDTVMFFFAHFDLHDKNSYILKSVNGPVDVPYRCFLPIEIEGLITSGRMLSTDRLANSAIRHMERAFRSGQVAGTAAALSLKEGVIPSKLNVKKLQSELIANDFKITKGNL